MSFVVLIFILLLVAACLTYQRIKLAACPETTVKSFFERASRGPIAHRASQPENTLAGIRRSKQLGASGVEVDVRFTKDGHPVLIHDATVDRTSDGRGKVCEMTLREVRELDFGSKFGYVSLVNKRVTSPNILAVYLFDSRSLRIINFVFFQQVWVCRRAYSYSARGRQPLQGTWPADVLGVQGQYTKRSRTGQEQIYLYSNVYVVLK